MSKTTYRVADGHVLRGAEKVAAYDTSTGLLDFLPGKSNYRAPVVRFLKDAKLPVEVKPDVPPAAPSEAGPRATRVGVNLDRPVEEKAPEQPRPEDAPEPAPARPARIGDEVVETVKKDGKPVPYRSRLTEHGWV